MVTQQQTEIGHDPKKNKSRWSENARAIPIVVGVSQDFNREKCPAKPIKIPLMRRSAELMEDSRNPSSDTTVLTLDFVGCSSSTEAEVTLKWN